MPPQLQRIMTARSMANSEPPTVTVKLHWLVLPHSSAATHVTVVTPSGNTEPEGGLQVMITGPTQLSVAVTAKFTTAPLVSQALATRLVGQWMTGGVAS